MFPSVTSAAELKLKDRDCDSVGSTMGKLIKKALAAMRKLSLTFQLKKNIPVVLFLVFS